MRSNYPFCDGEMRYSKNRKGKIALFFDIPEEVAPTTKEILIGVLIGVAAIAVPSFFAVLAIGSFLRWVL